MADSAYPSVGRVAPVIPLRRVAPVTYAPPAQEPLPFVHRPETPQETLDNALATLGRLGATEDEATRFLQLAIRKATIRGEAALCAHPGNGHDHQECLEVLATERLFGLPVLG